MKLPYSAIAILAQVTQETATVAIRRMVQELAVQVRRGFSLSISMGQLGVLWSRGRTCGFRFEKKKKVGHFTRNFQSHVIDTYKKLHKLDAHKLIIGFTVSSL